MWQPQNPKRRLVKRFLIAVNQVSPQTKFILKNLIVERFSNFTQYVNAMRDLLACEHVRYSLYAHMSAAESQHGQNGDWLSD